MQPGSRFATIAFPSHRTEETMARKSRRKGAARPQFKLASPDIRPNGPIALEQVFNGFGCSGQNISPALKWSGAPADTKSFALLVHDPDAPTGAPGWGGPCPPVGDKPHRYNFTLYALKVDRLDVSGATASLAGYMVNGNAIGKAKLTGKFGRKK